MYFSAYLVHIFVHSTSPVPKNSKMRKKLQVLQFFTPNHPLLCPTYLVCPKTDVATQHNFSEIRQHVHLISICADISFTFPITGHVPWKFSIRISNKEPKFEDALETFKNCLTKRKTSTFSTCQISRPT